MPINVRKNQGIGTLSDNILKCVEDYKYLGSHIQNSEKDFNIRKGIAWTACNKMNKIWKSDLARDFLKSEFSVYLLNQSYFMALKLGLSQQDNRGV